MTRILLIALALNLTACASYFKKKECESVNWFEHGKKVALRGEWLNSDKLVNECRKVEAEIQESQLDQGFKSGMQKYCSPSYAYQVGKSGDFYSREVCEGPQINVLLAEHKKGVKDYCAKSNGQNAGASGKKYQNICPKDLEPAFLAEYRKGRKRYVQAMISSRESDIHEIETKIASRRADLSYNQGRLGSLEGEVSALEAQRNFTPIANSSQRSYLDGRISSLSTDVSSLRSTVSGIQIDINNLDRERKTKMDEIKEFKAELPSLD
ncbi:DUF2799 domain-containing protein [Bdellovibrio sp. BCCA]|uniref:DUF2799 domain-containing protein n=1 Tax=Bdellovibrio sp. BCCA TaxID=3136281 RepID=UPI0030F2C707